MSRNFAAVAHNNPDNTSGWWSFFAAMIVIAGGGFVLAGAVAGLTAWRGAQRPGARSLRGVLSAATGLFVAVGLAIGAIGVWLS
ncbi:UNVERIFIED_CONTAM: hypothetical protein RKD50_003789 [Streptomyces canus]